MRTLSSAIIFGLGLALAPGLGCGSSNGDATTGGSNGSTVGGDDTSGSTSGDDTATDDGGSGGNGDSGVPAGAVCAVVSYGSNDLLITGEMLLPAGPTPGELLIDTTGKIVCADASCSAAAGYANATHLACPNGVVSPALINTHDHTEYATVAPQALGTTRYACRNEWRTGADGATKSPHVNSTTDAKIIAAQELRFVMGGATSIVGSGGVGGLARNLADYSNQAFLEGLSGKTVYFDTFPLGDSNGTVLTSGCGYPSTRSTSQAFQDGSYAPHIAEGINAAAHNEITCANGAGLLTAQTSVIHGVGLNATDVKDLASAGAKLVWSPRSNIDLYGDTAAVTVYKAEGVTIALGTDWLASGSMNMLRELACADSFNTSYLHGAFTDRDLWEMVTKNAAIAAGFDSQIGTLEAGKVADIAIFDGSVNKDYRAVIAAGVEDVAYVMRGGKTLYGDADIVNALAKGCGAISVCNGARAVCLDVPGVTLADVQAAAASVYPLFACKGAAPAGEPSCTPYRSTYESGITAGDQDGDGVADGSDDCPNVFNPARPMDGTAQSDVDGDGAGDACDAKPLDASTH